MAKSLKKDDKGFDVAVLQLLLNLALGLKGTSKLKPDGGFGQKTTDKVVAFQKAMATPPAAKDLGIVDDPTWDALRKQVGKKKIAVTFDDGPDPKITEAMLAGLKAAGAKATFFVLGKQVEARPAVLGKIVGDGHEVGNHSWKHDRYFCMKIADMLADAEKTHDRIVKEVGAARAPKLLRPPYGDTDSSRIHEIEVAAKLKYKVVGWDVDPEDWNAKKTPKDIYDTVLINVDPDEVVLAHDVHKRTAVAMLGSYDGETLPGPVKDGLLKVLGAVFDLVTVSDLGSFTHGGFSSLPCKK